MKNFKTLALSLLFFIGFIIPSCKDGLIDCSCGNDIYFDVNGLDLLFLEDLNSYTEITTDSIEFSEFDGIVVDYLVDYHAHLQTRQDWSFSLMNTANACSCLPSGYSGSKTEKLTALSIITVNDFDANHLAGSEINDLVDYFGRPFEPNSNESSLEEYLANQNGENLEHEDLLLKLKKAPEANTPFQVKIMMELSTGEKYETTSKLIVFK